MQTPIKEDYKLSKYNSAIAQLVRLDILWKDAHNHSRKGNYSNWSADLDKVWSELAGDLNAGTTEEKEFESFEAQINKVGKLSAPIIRGFVSNEEDSSDKRSKHYQILLKKEIWLRRLQNKLGKGTSYADEFEDDFE